jgi:hypothetical protein
MSNLLVYTDFVGNCQLSISNLKLAEFNAFLTVHEAKFLRSVLGVKLYNSFVAGWTGTIASKWTDLINGCDYVMDDVTYHFDGLKEALKYWSYAEWQRQNSIINTGQSNISGKSENAETVAPLSHVVNAVSNCFDLVVEADLFITEKGESVYADYLFTNPVTLINIFGI